VEHRRAKIELDDLRMLVGDGAAAMIARGFAATGAPAGDMPPLVSRFLEIYHAAIAEHSRPFPGVVDVLERLAAENIKLAVCTNKSTPGTHQLLAELDLARHFTCVVGGDGPVRKPDPRHILTVTKALRVKPDEAVMVGDSANDVNAAKGAGIKVVAVTFGYTSIPAHQLGADAVIERFAELPGLLGLR
jgi:phosphoglycolate phosphatase